MKVEYPKVEDRLYQDRRESQTPVMSANLMTKWHI